MIKNELLDLVSFLKKPIFSEANKTIKEKVLSFILILIIDLLLMLVVFTFFFIFKDFLEEAFKTHKMKELLEELPVWGILILGVIVAPIGEELVFRFVLKYRKWSLYVFMPLLLSISINIIFWIVNIQVNKMVVYFICLALFVIFDFKFSNVIKNIFKYKFHYLFYFVTILFALVHIQNFTYSKSLLILIPLLVLPQLFTGIFLGYLRVKLGFIWSMLLHFSHNAIFMIPLILSLNTNVTKTTIDTENYYLNLTENSIFSNKDDYSSYSRDSIVIKNYTIEKCLTNLLNKERNQIEIKNNSFNQFVKINIVYKSKRASNLMEDDKENILKVLKNVYNFSVSNEIKEKMFNEIYIKDTLLFNKIRTPESKELGMIKNSSLYQNGQNFTLTNATPKSFSRILNEVYPKVNTFIFKENKDLQFSLEAKNIPFKKLKIYLESNYGLSFKEITKKVEFSLVMFNK